MTTQTIEAELFGLGVHALDRRSALDADASTRDRHG
jgi:hypothetical protein